jgi:hypothetical protein
VPDDLLRFVSGAPPYSPWWLALALTLLIAVTGWYVGVFVWTLPAARLRRLPGIRVVHGYVLRRRFTRSIRKVVESHRAGDIPAVDAGARISRTLRSFLHQATGTAAQFMHVDALDANGLPAAARVVSALNDVRFNATSDVDVGEAGEAVEELIRTWR